MMFRDMIAIDSESSTKAQETVGEKIDFLHVRNARCF